MGNCFRVSQGINYSINREISFSNHHGHGHGHMRNRSFSSSLFYPTNYRSAGILFHLSSHHILGGYHTNKPVDSARGITGVGGKKNASDPSPLYCAWRETFEELLGITPANIPVFYDLIKQYPPRYFHAVGSVGGGGGGGVHMLFEYNIATLFAVMNEYAQYQAKSFTSIYYTKMPRTVNELIFERKHVHNAEIITLCALPLPSPGIPVASTMKILPELLQDISFVQSAHSIPVRK